MSSDGKNDATASVIAPPVTLASPPCPTQSDASAPHVDLGDNQSPLHLRNLSRLLLRENVEFALVIGGATQLRVTAELHGGQTDAKTFAVGADGCFVLLRLSDNPEKVEAGFYEVRTPEEDAKGEA